MSGVMTEWAADALIPDAIWYAGWDQLTAPRTLRIGAETVEAPDLATPDGAAAFVRLMALVMLERAAGDDACTDAHLAAAGFTAAEIARHADKARALARQLGATQAGAAAAPPQRPLRLKPVWPVFRRPAGRAVVASVQGGDQR